jgi:predicted PurR-regulated permease PerM
MSLPPLANDVAAPVAATTPSSSAAGSAGGSPEIKTVAHPSVVESDNGSTFYSRAFGITATAILGVALYQIVAPFFGPLMWAMFLAFLLHPVHVRLARRFKGRSNLSASILTFGTFVLLIGPLAGMSAAFAAQSADLVQWIQEALSKQSRQQYRVLADAPVIGPLLEWIRENFDVRASQIQGWIAQATKQLPQFLAGLGGKIFLGAVNTVLAFVVMLFMLFFFVRDGAEFYAILRDLIPMKPRSREQLMDHLAAVTRAVVFGTGITALAQGTFVGIGFLITGLNSPLVFGVIAALLALLPFGGTAFVWIPAVIALAAQDRWGMAVVMLIIGIISSTADNFLRPLLISGRAEVGTLTVFIGVLGGTAAFGPIGIFLGPILLALIIALIQFAREVRRSAA